MDRLIMNERMMMGDPRMMPDGQGECVGANLLLNDHIHIKRPMNAFMCWAQVTVLRMLKEDLIFFLDFSKIVSTSPSAKAP